MQTDHVAKRRTLLGQWLPVCFYSLNLCLWIVTGIRVGAWILLFLAVLPLQALAVYL